MKSEKNEFSEKLDVKGDNTSNDSTEEYGIVEDDVIRGRKKNKWYDVLYWLVIAFRNYRTAFFVTLLGLFAQSFHFYHVVKMYSNLIDDAIISTEVHSYLLALFLSLGVLYFTLRVGVSKTNDQYRSYMNTVNGFAFFEAFINLYYWTNKFLFLPLQNGDPVNWWSLVITVPLSIAIPVVIKTYAGEIKPKMESDSNSDYKVSLDRKMVGGKYKGHSLEWVVVNDPDYAYNYIKNMKKG